jgi:hypothetical protein
MIRILPAGFAVMLGIALLSQGSQVAEAARARGATMHFHSPSWSKGSAGPRNFTGIQKQQRLLLPAVQKIREAGGGGGGGGGSNPRPKPKEDCMSCAN